MANLFSYIDEIREVGGHEGLLEVGSPVMARTLQGYEPLGNPLEEGTLVGALTAVLTSEQQVDLAVGNIIQFPVERPSGRWHVLIESTTTGLRVRMRGPALASESKLVRRVGASTPAVFIETPADSGGGFAIPLGENGKNGADGAIDVSDPFQEVADAGDAEESSSGVYEQPDWDVDSDKSESLDDDEQATAADGTIAATAAAERSRQTLTDNSVSDKGSAGTSDEANATVASSASAGLDPFLIEDDLDDEFEIEDPFADFGGSSPVTQANSSGALEDDEDVLDDTRSPFDFDDNEFERGDTETTLDSVDGATTPELAREVSESGRPAAEVTPAAMEEWLGEEMGSAEEKPSDAPVDDRPDAIIHDTGSYEAMRTDADARWSELGEGTTVASLVEPLPNGSLCHLLGGGVFEASGVEVLTLKDGDDKATFVEASRGRAPGRVLCLDVEDPSPWLSWIGRQIEAGSTVLVHSDAATAEGAWRCLVGLQSRSRAEVWFGRHPQYAVLATNGGYAITRRNV